MTLNKMSVLRCKESRQSEGKYLFIYMKSLSENSAGLDLQFRSVLATFSLRCSVRGPLHGEERFMNSCLLNSFKIIFVSYVSLKEFPDLLRLYDCNMSCF